MKKSLLVFAFIFSFNSFSQNDLLGEWFVQKISHSGTEYPNDYNHFFSVKFLNNTLNDGYEANGSLICNGYGAVYNILDATSIEIYTTGITLSECDTQNENLYESNYADILFNSNGQGNPKELNYQINGSGDTASLILTANNGDYVVYNKQSLIEQLLSGDWFLEEIKTNNIIDDVENTDYSINFGSIANQVSTYSGDANCNSINGSIVILSNLNLEISDCNITTDTCNPIPSYESDYLTQITCEGSSSIFKRYEINDLSTNPKLKLINFTNDDYLLFGKQNLAINSLEIQPHISIFPNPVNDILNINSKREIVNYTIYDLNGRRMNDLQSSSNKIDVSKLNPGIYFLKLTAKNKQAHTLKFIKL